MKYNQRALALAERAASIVLALYCSHIVSILSYIGQLEPLGADAVKSLREHYWRRRLIHMIPSTSSHEALTKLSVVGLPRVPPF